MICLIINLSSLFLIKDIFLKEIKKKDKKVNQYSFRLFFKVVTPLILRDICILFDESIGYNLIFFEFKLTNFSTRRHQKDIF